MRSTLLVYFVGGLLTLQTTVGLTQERSMDVASLAKEIEAIGGFPKVEEERIVAIKFRGGKKAGRDFAVLRKCTHLEDLWVERTEFGDADLRAVRNLPLHRLSLVGTEVTAEGLKELGAFRALRSLHLGSKSLEGVSVGVLSKLPLEEFSSTGPWLSLDGIDQIKGLRRVFLAERDVSNEVLTSLTKLDRLEDVSFFEVRMKGAEIGELGRLRALRRINFTRSDIGDADVAHLLKIPSLRFVDLSDTHVTGAGVATLAGLSEIEDLRLENTKVSDAGLRGFGRQSKLVRLDLGGTEVTDEGVLLLKDLPHLEVLNLDRTFVTARGAAALKKASKSLRQLQHGAPRDL